MVLLDELLAPIPGDDPSGPSLRYDPVYDKIKEARREELDLPQGGWETTVKTADWAQVEKLATDCLATRTKDLQIAAWLTEAWLRRQGVGGLRDGLELMRRLVEEFWDTLHPELEDGDPELRAAPLDWVGQYLEGAVRATPLTQSGHGLVDYTGARTLGYEKDAEGDADRRAARQRAVEEGKLTPEQFDQAFAATSKAWYKQLDADLDAALEALEALDRVAEERFADEAPSFLRVRQALQEVRQAVAPLLAKKLAADPDPPEVDPPVTSAAGAPVEGTPAGGDGAARAASAGTTGTASALDGIPVSPVPGSGEEAAARIAAAARFLRSQSPTAPAPYLLLRGFRWGELQASGDGIDPTLLVAPPTDVRTRLKHLLLEERWKELLEAAEEVMAQPYGRGWLDLQRYVLTACDALGSDYDALAGALRSALLSLLRDRPELASAALMDDSPAANAETRAWLREAGLFADQEDDPGLALGRPAGRRDALDRAQEQLRNGEPGRAIQLLMRQADQEVSPRARFLRRLQAARIMVEAGFESVALPLLREMIQQIETHTLEQWEAGETVAQPLVLLYRCMRSNDQYGETDELFLRISRLDPLQAIQLSAQTDADAGD